MLDPLGTCGVRLVLLRRAFTNLNRNRTRTRTRIRTRTRTMTLNPPLTGVRRVLLSEVIEMDTPTLAAAIADAFFSLPLDALSDVRQPSP